MSKEITIYNKSELSKIKEFDQQVLSVEPRPEEIRINPFANKSKYVPISIVEQKLDEIFIAWKTENFRTGIIGNEITGIITLSILHPVLGIWISYEGAAATQIQFRAIYHDKSGNEVDKRHKEATKQPVDVMNTGLKITNTLVKDYPHLKAECIKNAAKSIGKTFGRDLNRKDTMNDYEGLTIDSFVDQDVFNEIKNKIKTLRGKDLIEYFKILEDQYKTKEILNLFTIRKQKLSGL